MKDGKKYSGLAYHPELGYLSGTFEPDEDQNYTSEDGKSSTVGYSKSYAQGWESIFGVKPQAKGNPQSN
jgi:hypothetical protein